MKTMAEKDKAKQAAKKPVIQRPGQRESEELKTDPPLSEKDEVKKAEERTQQNIRR
jgi:hypothetical protein